MMDCPALGLLKVNSLVRYDHQLYLSLVISNPLGLCPTFVQLRKGRSEGSMGLRCL